RTQLFSLSRLYGPASNRPLIRPIIARVREDTASGSVLISPVEPVKPYLRTLFCLRSCIKTPGISIVAPGQRGRGLGTPSQLHLSVRETMGNCSQIILRWAAA